MPLYGKCPKCEQSVSRLDISTPDAHNAAGKTFNAVTYLCPNCQTVLGASLDPVAVANDLGTRLADDVSAKVRALRERLEQLLHRP